MNFARRRRRWVMLAAAYIPALLLLSLVAYQDAVPTGYFTRDAIAVAELPFWVGSISSLGVLLWCGTASICFFTSCYGRISRVDIGPARYLLFSGYLTTILMLDDLFLIHEQVVPELLSVSDAVVIAVYVTLALLHFFYFRRDLFASEVYLLGLAFGFFAISLFFDMVPAEYWPFFWKQKMFVVEDGAKLLGIISWFLYFSRLSLTALIQARHTIRSEGSEFFK